MAEDEKPPTKRKRFFKMAKMTASVATSYASSRVKGVFQSDEEREAARSKMHSDAGEKIAETLGELKGAVMKVGQMASVATDLLPEEFTEALKGLQRGAPPMSYDVIAQQIERELGSPPELLFDSFDREPFAAASIGQVHHAVTDDGRPVVVKVQYPGVDDSVDGDLRQLKLALRASGMVHLNRHGFNLLFEELRARIIEELDYCLEADNVRLFNEMHADDDWVIVPQVVGERSSQRVLTLTYEEGDPLEALHDEPYTQEIRDEIGENLYRIYGTQLFKYHAVHGDPNPGNYAFRPDGTVVLYDYGCVKKLSPKMVCIYRDIMHAAMAQEFGAIDDLLFEMGARIPDSPDVPAEFYQRWYEVLLEEVVENEIFDYRESRHHIEVMKLLPEARKRLRSFQPPAEGAIINRVVGGLHNMFRKIGPRLRWIGLLQDHVAMAEELEREV